MDIRHFSFKPYRRISRKVRLIVSYPGWKSRKLTTEKSDINWQGWRYRRECGNKLKINPTVFFSFNRGNCRKMENI